MPARRNTILKYSSDVCPRAESDALALQVGDLAGIDAGALTRDDSERLGAEKKIKHFFA